VPTLDHTPRQSIGDPGQRHPLPAGSCPSDWRQLLALSDEKLSRFDIAELNLICAGGMPGAENIDLGQCLRTIDRMAERTRVNTFTNLKLFSREPERWNTSPNIFRIHVMIWTLQRDENDEERAGVIREQVQDSQAGKTLHTTQVVTVEAKPGGRGVTVRQVQASLKELYVEAEASSWYPNSLLPELGSAIVTVSRELNAYPARGGIAGAVNIAREQWQGSKKVVSFRLDVDNVTGHNLRVLA
jgi:hypothetical protein